MIKVKLEADNFKDFMKQLKQGTKNMAPAFRDFADYMRKETENQYATETDPEGRPWAPLKPSTIKRKKTPYKLRETLVMYNSIGVNVTDEKFIFAIKDDKYKYHHTGTSKMPARVVLAITNDRRKKANEFVIAQIRRVKGKRAR